MQTVLSPLQTNALDSTIESKPTFKVLIAYEDFAAGRHAKETYDYLVRQLGSDFEFESQMWSFDVMRNANLRGMAAHDALEADMIIVSSTTTAEVPFGFKSWVEAWSKIDFNALVIVNLETGKPGDNSAPSAMHAYMQRVALTAKVAFFSQPGEWPEAEGVPEILQPAHRASRTSLMMASLIQEQAPASRFGINE